MAQVFAPATEQDLADIMRASTAGLRLHTHDTKSRIGNPVNATDEISLAGFSGITLYEPEELIFEAGVGMAMADVEATLAARGQMLAFEPPDLTALLGTGRGSLGGCVATGLSGPRRIKAGAVRDHVLGVRAVTGAGDIIATGARVVKNVTGYDLPKLLTASHGTLAAMTTITLKVMPRPETETTLLVNVQSPAEAVKVMSLALQSQAEVSSAAHVPGTGTGLRLEGISASVAARLALLRTHFPKADVLADDQSRKFWESMRNVQALAHLGDHAIWRISVPPMDAPRLLAAMGEKLDITFTMDWAGGLIWLATPAGDDCGAAIIRAAITSGHATLIRAPEALRPASAAFQPQPNALRLLSARVKQAFDPDNRLNPGRMAS